MFTVNTNDMVYHGEYVPAGKIKGAKSAIAALIKAQILVKSAAVKVGNTIFRVLDIKDNSVIMQSENKEWGHYPDYVNGEVIDRDYKFVKYKIEISMKEGL